MSLSANKGRAFEGGPIRIEENAFGVAASQKIYDGSAVGIVDASGYARALNAADRFAGFADGAVDNSVGAATDAALSVGVIQRGFVQLAVSGAVITDLGQPVYATDDDTFVFSPVGGAFIGFVHRFVSAGIAVVAFDALNMRDPYGENSVRLAVTNDLTLDATHTGKLLWVTVDAKTITLPAVAAGLDGVKIVNGGAFGTVLVTIAPNASDSIFGPDITAADNKGLLNTKATARRGDFAVIGGNDADGNAVQALRGTWARAA